MTTLMERWERWYERDPLEGALPNKRTNWRMVSVTLAALRSCVGTEQRYWTTPAVADQLRAIMSDLSDEENDEVLQIRDWDVVGDAIDAAKVCLGDSLGMVPSVTEKERRRHGHLMLLARSAGLCLDGFKHDPGEKLATLNAEDWSKAAALLRVYQRVESLPFPYEEATRPVSELWAAHVLATQPMPFDDLLYEG